MHNVEQNYLPLMIEDCTILKNALNDLRKAIETKNKIDADKSLVETIIPVHRMLNLIFPTLGKTDALIPTPIRNIDNERAKPFFTDLNLDGHGECRMIFVDIFLKFYKFYMITTQQVLNGFDVGDGTAYHSLMLYYEHLNDLITCGHYSIAEIITVVD